MGPKNTSLNASWKSVCPFHKLIGALLVGTFILIWLSSAASPALLVFSLYHGYHLFTSIVLFVTIVAYTPWKRGGISDTINRVFNTYHPCYYRGVNILTEEDTALSSASNKQQQQQQQTFYAIHPHGAFCLGWSMLFCSPLMSHVRFCFAPSLFASPFFRLFSRLVGKPGSAARFAMTSYLKRGESVALPPGGFEEATLTSRRRDIDRVFIKKRTGFVKLSLKHGAAIRPVYVFGEKRLYDNIQGWWNIRLRLNRYGVPTILTWGFWLFPLLPKPDSDLLIVIGKPLVLPKIEEPTKADVELWHGKYVAALTNLFEEHKEDAYGAEDGKTCKLEVW
mmetsp:Transcript_6528/g.9488  ORF Transcript_6528/g.9488 Transcript_6528/m.9488 type:complete len:336 (+) Transcript_6528:64-1071(+)|eukprot:CAMPEP_0195522732 /NCGR_PEP_ID=MMETSP0794_2-20130614/21180_1 /TAXON_ID=515487 /ORGANISM="Stephanopyxis turris, Strain CCMP 815" /LENGTH=335 /DNA_ID=CAMNT_0040652561 /DNA_START=64 /DNA_END=1071 /DNA_ORIENTATION=+